MRSAYLEERLIQRARNEGESICSLPIYQLEHYLKYCNLNLNFIESRTYNTALILAAERGDTELASFLVKGRCDLNLTNIHHDSALIVAARKGHKAIVFMLVNSVRCNLNHKGGWDRTALMLAAINDYKEIAFMLINSERCELNITNLDGDTALMLAARNGHKEIVFRLIHSGRCNLNCKSSIYDGRTALMYAIEGGYNDIAVALINAGADVNIQDDEEKTALDYAMNHRNFSLACLLLEKCGVEINNPTMFLDILYQVNECDPNVLILFRHFRQQQDILREAKLPTVFPPADKYLETFEEIYKHFLDKATYVLNKKFEEVRLADEKGEKVRPVVMPTVIVRLIAEYENSVDRNRPLFFSDQKKLDSNRLKSLIDTRKVHLKQIVQELKEKFNPNTPSPRWLERWCGSKLFLKEEQERCKIIGRLAGYVERLYFSQAVISKEEHKAAIDLIKKDVSLHCEGFPPHFEIKIRERQFLERIKEFSDQHWLRISQ